MAKLIQHQIIARALDLISDDSRWTRAAMARMADGRPCACLDPLAVRFCGVGALYRAAAELFGAQSFNCAVEAEEFVVTANKCSLGLPSINDVEGRAAIVEMFTIALRH